MTSATHSGYPGLQAIAGGRGDWSYNPERCEIVSADINNASFEVKVSAGGYDRGVAILLRIPFSVFSEVMPKLLINSNIIDIKSIENVFLSDRAMRILKNHSIENIGTLRAMSKKELLSLDGFGRVSVQAVETWLHERGLALRRD